MILALAGGDRQPPPRLLGSPLDRAAVDEARALIRSNGAVASAIDVARRYARQADEAIDGFPKARR